MKRAVEKPMASGQDVCVQACNAADADWEAILQIQKQSPEAAQWSRRDYQSALKNGGLLLLARKETPGPTREPAFLKKDTASDSGLPEMQRPSAGTIGFLLARCVADEAEILNLAVCPEARRNGVASALLKEAFTWATDRGAVVVHLEVRFSNIAAIRFYEAHNFRRAGVRRLYYANPLEDGILLRRPLRQEDSKPRLGREIR